MELERYKLGISGLDEILGGGVPKKSTLLLIGTPGTGKTTFTIQIAMSALRRGEKVAYITSITEPIYMVNSFASPFDFFDGDLFNAGTILVNLGSLMKYKDIGMVMEDVVDKIRANGVSLVIFDPVTVLRYYIKDRLRETLDEIFMSLKSTEATMVMTGELTEANLLNAPEGYLADGIIALTTKEFSNHVYRRLKIIKMRGISYSMDIKRYDITKEGIVVYEEPEIDFERR